MTFPTQRPRRLRSRPALRRLVRETSLAPEDLIYPLFVRDAIDEPRPIEAMPGHQQHTIDSLTREAEAALKVGVRTSACASTPSMAIAACSTGRPSPMTQPWSSTSESPSRRPPPAPT